MFYSILAKKKLQIYRKPEEEVPWDVSGPGFHIAAATLSFSGNQVPSSLAFVNES